MAKEYQTTALDWKAKPNAASLGSINSALVLPYGRALIMLLPRTITVLFFGLLILCASWVELFAGTEPKASPPTFEAWLVLDVQTAKPITFDTWVESLVEQDVIYLGEEHRNHWHIEAALKVLRAMIDRGTRPVLAMEMFGWNGQPAINRYMRNADMPRKQFLKASYW